jgi:hypothetical protein
MVRGRKHNKIIALQQSKCGTAPGPNPEKVKE